jgi:hypothetical protein
MHGPYKPKYKVCPNSGALNTIFQLRNLQFEDMRNVKGGEIKTNKNEQKLFEN